MGGSALATTTAVTATKITSTVAFTATAMTASGASTAAESYGRTGKVDAKATVTATAKTGTDVLEYAMPVTRIVKGTYEGYKALNAAQEHYNTARASNDSAVKIENYVRATGDIALAALNVAAAASGVKETVTAVKGYFVDFKCNSAATNGSKTTSTGTVWDSTKATSSKIPDTEIPSTFELRLNDNVSYTNPQTGTNVLWTNSNATKHMGEYIRSAGSGSWGVGIRSQAMIESYSASVNEAMLELATKPAGRYFGMYGNWQLGINTETGVVFHALMK